ncbi:hypothetical protein JWG41_18215 [Leptospira sp. 201903075]|uniref:hypothetical protein n=1 Tax=Leptospira chreensis TaxID=2810035 RepID=UPI0019632212|nr:hypothetical protein [Leptospira chreensis]MBM9592384.1 hypothetical protein [Leptospira chreensis]
MEKEFKTIYDPSRKVTYEQASQFSNYRMVMAAQSQASSGDPEDPPVSFNIKDHFLVGEVSEGEFGKHNHDEFWEILTQKDTLDFLDQVVGKEQQRKAKKKADREGKIEAVVTVIAAVAASIVTGGAAAVALAPMMSVGAGSAVFIASAAVVGGYVAYKGHQGYQAGGVAGGILAAGSAAASLLGPPGLSIGGSYTKEQGFGFNVGGQLSGTPLSAGIGFSEKGGFGFNAGIKLSDNVSLNMNVHESGAWGVGASFHMADGGDRRGLAANVGYRETADGQVGRSAGFGYNSAVGNGGTLYTGLTTDSLLGNGFLVNIEEGSNDPTASGGLMGYEGEVGWSTGGGFQSSLELRFNSERFRNKLKGKGFSSDQEVDQAEFDLLHKDKSDLERAKGKKAKGLPLNAAEFDALESEAKQREGNKNQGAGVGSGLGYVFGRGVGTLLGDIFGVVPTKSGGKNNLLDLNPSNMEKIPDRIQEKETGGIHVVGRKYDYQVADGPNKLKVGFVKDYLGYDTEEIQYLSINGKEVNDSSIIKLGKDGKMSVVSINEVSDSSTVFVNGIKNNPMDAINNIKTIQGETGGDVYLVYNKSNGLVADLANSVTGLASVDTEASQKVLTELIKAGKVGTLMAHSQGSVISGNALIAAKDAKAEINSINWVTFGGPIGGQNIPSGLASAVFYENHLDPVPYLMGTPYIGVLNRIGRNASAKLNGYKTKISGIWGHNFINNYDAALRDYLSGGSNR